MLKSLFKATNIIIKNTVNTRNISSFTTFTTFVMIASAGNSTKIVEAERIKDTNLLTDDMIIKADKNVEDDIDKKELELSKAEINLYEMKIRSSLSVDQKKIIDEAKKHMNAMYLINQSDSHPDVIAARINYLNILSKYDKKENYNIYS